MWPYWPRPTMVFSLPPVAERDEKAGNGLPFCALDGMLGTSHAQDGWDGTHWVGDAVEGRAGLDVCRVNFLSGLGTELSLRSPRSTCSENRLCNLQHQTQPDQRRRHSSTSISRLNETIGIRSNGAQRATQWLSKPPTPPPPHKQRQPPPPHLPPPMTPSATAPQPLSSPPS